MKKIKNAIEQMQQDYPRSLNDYYPAYAENGIPERNLTFQFVCAYLKLNNEAHGFFEVPFKSNSGEIQHYDAIVFDPSALIIIEAKRLYSKEKAIAIQEDADKIKNSSYRKEILGNFNNFTPPQIYGLILAQAGPKMFKGGLEDWWKGSGNSGIYENWVAEGVCENMNEWECDSIDVKYYYVDNDDKKEDAKFHILYGYKDLS